MNIKVTPKRREDIMVSVVLKTLLEKFFVDNPTAEKDVDEIQELLIMFEVKWGLRLEIQPKLNINNINK